MSWVSGSATTCAGTTSASSDYWEFQNDWAAPKPQPAVRTEPTGLTVEKAARL